MSDYVSKYGFEDEGYGVVISDLKSGKSCFLQGDAAGDFLAEIEKLDALWMRIWAGTVDRPPAFSCYEEHLDVILDPYTDVMQ